MQPLHSFEICCHIKSELNKYQFFFSAQAIYSFFSIRNNHQKMWHLLYNSIYKWESIKRNENVLEIKSHFTMFQLVVSAPFDPIQNVGLSLVRLFILKKWLKKNSTVENSFFFNHQLCQLNVIVLHVNVFCFSCSFIWWMFSIISIHFLSIYYSILYGIRHVLCYVYIDVILNFCSVFIF